MKQINRQAIQQQLEARGIDPNHIKALHIKLQTGQLNESSFVLDAQQLRAPQASDITNYHQLDTAALEQRGSTLLRADRLVIFWLNGGAATRYFDQSKITPEENQRFKVALEKIPAAMFDLPKGVTPVVDSMSYLELNLRNLLLITKRYRLAVHPQVILMNSFLTDKATREHLADLFKKYPSLHPDRFHYVVQQPLIPRFQKATDLKDIDLFVNQSDELSWAPCGHGDFVYLLQDYLRTHPLPNIEYLFFSNIDNLGATLDPVLLGWHAKSKVGRSVELSVKQPGDSGGVPCFVDNHLEIVEQMKFPKNFDYQTIPWFNTNTFWFTLQDLLAFKEDLPLVLAEKNVDDTEILQLEHFACDVTMPSQYIAIPRAQRFWPIKRYVDALIYQQNPDFKKLLQEQYEVC